MKKRKNKVLASVVTAGAVMGLAGVFLATSSSTFAASGGITRIYVYDSSASTAATCNIYHPSDSSANCNTSYGNYDATNSILTLGSGINNKTVLITSSTSSAETITINATSNISANLSTQSEDNLIFDLRNYSWTQLSGDTSYISFPESGVTEWKSGTLNKTTALSSGELKISGGVINTKGTNNATDGDVSAKTLTMTGGKLNMLNGDLKIKNKGQINGGELTINNPYGMGGLIELGVVEPAEFILNGGTVSLDAGGHSRKGINSTSGSSVTINGGSLNIDKVGEGIFLYGPDSSIDFQGGTTTIKNATTYALRVQKVSDYEAALSFGANMGIMESGLYVYYDHYDDNLSLYETGISGTAKVTIGEGGNVIRKAGWEIGDIDSDINGESGLMVPNTGSFSEENKGAIAAMISVASITIVSLIAFVTWYILKRYSARASFGKKH